MNRPLPMSHLIVRHFEFSSFFSFTAGQSLISTRPKVRRIVIRHSGDFKRFASLLCIFLNVFFDCRIQSQNNRNGIGVNTTRKCQGSTFLSSFLKANAETISLRVLSSYGKCPNIIFCILRFFSSEVSPQDGGACVAIVVLSPGDICQTPTYEYLSLSPNADLSNLIDSTVAIACTQNHCHNAGGRFFSQAGGIFMAPMLKTYMLGFVTNNAPCIKY